MDIVAHGLWTFVVVYVLSQWKLTARYFNTRKKLAAAVIAGFSIDLLFAPQFFYFLTHSASRDFHATAFPGWMVTWYWINHNYFFIAIIGLIVFLLFRGYTVPVVFALTLHVTMDIFTHKGFFELAPFWPIQQAPFHGLVSWAQPTFFKWSWITLLAVFLLVFLHMQYQKRKSLISKHKKSKDFLV